MGTRNLTMIYADGTYPVAKYCQWDGYPEGQGATLVEILRQADMDELKRKALACKAATDADFKAASEASIGSDPEWVTIDQSRKFHEDYPELHRDTGAEIVRMILASPDPLTIKHDIDFAANSLFCEWAYVVDLDAMRLEVFKGFNTQPLGPNDRFAFLAGEADGDYHPVRLVCSFDLHNLPQTDDDFLADLVNAVGEDE